MTRRCSVVYDAAVHGNGDLFVLCSRQRSGRRHYWHLFRLSRLRRHVWHESRNETWEIVLVPIKERRRLDEAMTGSVGVP